MKRLALALAFALAALPALAQTVLSTPSNFTYGARAVQGPPDLNIGVDSVTALPCIVATAATCQVPTVARISNGRQTYRYEGTYTPYAATTDTVCVNGSPTAGRTVRLTEFGIRPSSTASANYTPYWVKRSTADTGGTPTARVPIALDSQNATPTGTITEYASAPTLGTTVGTLASYVTASVSPTNTEPSFRSWRRSAQVPLASPDGASFEQYPTLRGAAEGVCVNFAGATLAAGFTFTYTISWVESTGD